MFFKLEWKYGCHICDWIGMWNSWLCLCQWDYIKVQGFFLHCIRSLTGWAFGRELSRQSERWLWDLLLQWQWDNQHDPWSPGTSLSQLTVNSCAPLQGWCFPGYHFFPLYHFLLLQYSFLPAGSISSLPGTPPAGLSPDPKLLWELPGIFPGILWESGHEKCLFQRAEKPEGSVPPFSCHTKLGSTRHNFASGLSFCSVRIKLQQLYPIEINVRHSKAALTFGIWAGTPQFTWGKHWAASSLELCLLHNKQTNMGLFSFQ